MGGGKLRRYREDEHDGREPGEEDEPSLGSQDRLMNQVLSWRFDQWEIDFEADGRTGRDDRVAARRTPPSAQAEID